MAASGSTPIQLYYSTTSSSVPVNTNLVAGELAINTADGKLYYKDSSNVVQLLADGGSNSHLSWSAANNTLTVDAVGSLRTAVGTTAQRPATPANGMLRFNSTLARYEAYAPAGWQGVVGSQGTGAIIVNNKTISASDTITSTQNGYSVGPITIAPGVTITTASTSRWIIT